MKTGFTWATLLVSAIGSVAVIHAEQPLASWNDTATKGTIIHFVTRVTDETSDDFIPAAQRIAVFDNDGTLWSEKPVYFQAFFIIDRVRKLAPSNPDWETREPFASALRGDFQSVAARGEEGLLELVMATHTHTTTDQFDQIVRQWIAEAKHPQTGRRFTEMVYQPMLEVIDFLTQNGFQCYIVSGGGIDFMRPWTERVYGIPPERVIGSSVKTKFEIQNGRSVLVRLPELNFINDKSGKPVAIQHHIGRRPVIAIGNSDGDLEMLQWTSDQSKSTLAVIIHHTDGDREFAYDRQSKVGRLDKSLDVAKQQGWTIVDMKRDWKQIYRPLQSQ